MPNITTTGLARRNIAAMARQSADRAVQVIVDALSDTDVKVRLDAAGKLLDRAVGRPPQAIVGGDDEEDNPVKLAITKIERIIVDHAANSDRQSIPAAPEA